MEKGWLPIGDGCLGSTGEEVGPICHILIICALRLFLKVITFIELNYMEKQLNIVRFNDLCLLNIAF